MYKGENMQRFKKIIAVIISIIFVLAVMPGDVLANPQAPVNNLWLIQQTAPASQNYTFTLNWVRPPAIGGTIEPPNFVGAPQNPPVWDNHRATQYVVQRRNAALPPLAGNFVDVGNVASLAESPSFQYINNSLPFMERMQNGRIYAFRINAYHPHIYNVLGPGGIFLQQTVMQRVDGTMEVHFMSDIDVSAVGIGNEMTVEWSRPLIGAEDPFESYRIFFAPGGISVSNIFAQNFVDVAVDHPDLEIDGDMYRFTFSTPHLVPGAVYAVAVEPMIGTATRRTVSPSLADVMLQTRGITLHYTMNEYRTNNAFVLPRFQYTPIGIDLLQLNWDVPHSALSVTLRSRPVSIDAWTVVGSIHGPSTQVINYWLTQRPFATTEFWLEIELVDGSFENLFLIYDPSVTPFSPTRPNILDIDHSPPGHNPMPPITLDISWEAFSRLPYTQMDWADAANIWQDGAVTRYFDPNVMYEIFISDDLTTLNSLSTAVMGQVAAVLTPADMQRVLVDGVWAHQFMSPYYFNAAAGEMRPIIANKVYYVRINTRRTVSAFEVSFPAYGSHFIPGHEELRPVMVPAPPLRVYHEDIDSITIAWEANWLEVFEEASLTWHGRMAVRDGVPVFGTAIMESDTLVNLTDFPNAASLRAHLAALGVIIPVREQHLLPHYGFEIHVRPIADIAGDIAPPPEGNFDSFVAGIHDDPTAWTIVQPLREEGSGTMRFNITQSHGGAGLEGNRTYAIFFRPFNPMGEIRNVWWPTFLTGTTTDVRQPIEITPTVPMLSPHSAGDTWLRFDMRPFSTQLRYEFMISEFADFSTAWAFNPTVEEVFEQGGFTWRRFAATMLFPETNYYIWVRAAGVALDGSYIYSIWSNPIAMQTLPILTPMPPRGLGLASRMDLNIINQENGLELAAVEPDAMVITWLPHPGDDNLPIEMQDGAMGTEILGSPNILHSYLVRFSGLVANRPHYVRARTMYSIHRDAVGAPVSQIRYNYIVQFAANADFLDAITVYVLPDASDIVAGTNVRMALSEWTDAFIFHTARDDGEYDSDAIPELFPLPMHDFEIIYTAATQTLLFRFRSTGVDALGNMDNLVDQRFISRLIQLGVFDYEIDMSHYNNAPVRNRVVELPYSIITAMADRQISLSILAGDSSYRLQPGFANTPQNMGFNIQSRLRIYINDLAAGAVPALPDGLSYVVAPQAVDISVVQANEQGLQNNIVRLTHLAAALEVTQRVNQAAMMDFNITPHMRTADDVGWIMVDEFDFSDAAGTFRFTTVRPQHITAIAMARPNVAPGIDPIVRDALYFVNSQVAFEDLVWFVEDEPISAWQINNMILAIATGERTVTINGALNQEQMARLTNGGMLVAGGDTVTREAAAAALVRLYEVRTRTRVSGYPSLQTTGIADIEQVSAHLRQAVLRAEHLGFVYGPLVSPLGDFTMGEAILVFEIILRN